MGLDVERARQDTPGCLTVAHLNNAGASLQPSAVTNAVIAHLQLESTMGGYEAAARAAANVENTYAAVAQLLSCATNEIALVENATRAWDMAFYSMTFAPGDRILTTSAEYASNAIALLHVAQRTGAQVEV
ncbi:MAG: aminotransferase class V-fold PLP-dependent enzyme, partial [Mycobacteriaceae bacterium]